MSTNGETADLMVREGIQITESALKLAGRSVLTMLGKAVSFKLFNLQHLLLKPLRPIRKM